MDGEATNGQEDGAAAVGNEATLDTHINALAGSLVELDGSARTLDVLSYRWGSVAGRLEPYSAEMAETARSLSANLAALEQALGALSRPLETFIGAAGRTADRFGDGPVEL